MGWSRKKAKRRCVLLIPCNDSVNAPIKTFSYHGGASFLERKPPPSLILHLKKRLNLSPSTHNSVANMCFAIATKKLTALPMQPT
jgi:5-deoxy-D-glucuronate isomerase